MVPEDGELFVLVCVGFGVFVGVLFIVSPAISRVHEAIVIHAETSGELSDPSLGDCDVLWGGLFRGFFSGEIRVGPVVA